MGERVLIDKNVLLSSSIFATIEDVDSTIQHKFYEMSARLMNRIEENREVGIITNDVENRTKKILGKGTRDTIEDTRELPSPEEMDQLYTIITICNENLDDRIMACNRISLAEEELEELKNEIRNFYLDLRDKFDEVFEKSPSEKTQETLNKSDFYLEKETVESIRRNKRDPAFSTLLRKVKKNLIGEEDRLLLASAIKLNRGRYEEKKVYLASCDQHFVKVQNAESSDNRKFVPSAIKSEFGIICKWPDEIAEEIF